eukprot:4939533-Prorocentrum_lima.AAC.1
MAIYGSARCFVPPWLVQRPKGFGILSGAQEPSRGGMKGKGDQDMPVRAISLLSALLFSRGGSSPKAAGLA